MVQRTDEFQWCLHQTIQICKVSLIKLMFHVQLSAVVLVKCLNIFGYVRQVKYAIELLGWSTLAVAKALFAIHSRLIFRGIAKDSRICHDSLLLQILGILWVFLICQLVPTT